MLLVLTILHDQSRHMEKELAILPCDDMDQAADMLQDQYEAPLLAEARKWQPKPVVLG